MLNYVEELAAAVRSGEPLVRLTSDEPDNAAYAVEEAAAKGKWLFESWDAARGMRVDPALTQRFEDPPQGPAKFGEAVQRVIRQLERTTENGDDGETPQRVFLVRNLHLVLAAAPEPTLSWLDVFADLAETRRAHLVAPMPPEAKLPPEVAGRFHVVRQPLPDAAEAAGLVAERAAGGDRLDGAQLRRLADAANGLTRTQLLTACARGHVDSRGKGPTPEFVRAEKLKIVNGEKLVTVVEPGDDSVVGGNDGMMGLLRDLLAGNDRPGAGRAKGALVFGVPGTGKTMAARALGRATGTLVVQVDPGRLMGEFVGNTERNTRKLFDLLDILSPCLCLLDEVGKCMPSGRGGGNGGVDTRLMSAFLNYMNDSGKAIFWLLTANDDVLSLPPEFIRAGRVDLKFFVGLPGRAERATVWGIQAARLFGPDDSLWPESVRLAAQSAKGRGPIDDDGWTGGEIEACCRLSLQLRRPPEAVAPLITPVSKTGREQIDAMRKYAEEHGALDAHTGLPVGQRPAAAERPGRRATAAV